MSSLEYKIINKKFIKNIENFLFKYTKNNAISGYIVAMIHWVVMYIVYMYILLGNVDIFYYLCCGFLVITYMLHIYFSGCILIRIERIIWNTDKWWGIWTLFSFFTKTRNKNNKNPNKLHIHNMGYIRNHNYSNKISHK